MSIISAIANAITFHTVALFVAAFAIDLVFALSLLMTLRLILMLLSMLNPKLGTSKLSIGLIGVAEAIIYPIRLFCRRMGWFQKIPIDAPFLITILLISGCYLYLQTLVAYL